MVFGGFQSHGMFMTEMASLWPFSDPSVITFRLSAGLIVEDGVVGLHGTGRACYTEGSLPLDDVE